MMNGDNEDMQHTSTGEEQEGREPPNVPPNPNDNLNFGWFSLPREEQNADQDAYQNGSSSPHGNQNVQEAKGSRPPSQSGSRSGLRGNSRPPSQGGRPGSGSQYGRGGPMACAQAANGRGQTPQCQNQGWGAVPQPNCPTPGGTSQRLVLADDPHATEYGRPSSQHGRPPSQHGRPQNTTQAYQVPQDPYGGDVPPEIDAMDWPLSRAAHEMMRAAYPPAEPRYMVEEKMRCGGHSRNADMPPTPATPMPPLTLGGYRGSARPTFASWREDWHRANPHLQQTHCSRRRAHNGPPEDHDIFNTDRNRGDFNNNNADI